MTYTARFLITGFFLTLGLTVSLLMLSPAEVTRAQEFDRRTPVVVAVEKSMPAVVNISTQYVERRTVRPFGGGLFRNDPFFDLFAPPRTYTRTYQSLGSGTLVNPRGYVVTNEHVVAGASQLFVTLHDGTVLSGVVIAMEDADDLALIKLLPEEPREFPTVTLGRSDDLMIGETVIAVGNPFRLDHTVTRGVVSAVDRVIEAGEGKQLSGLIQTDAAINPGNSGGPLLNINAELIGLSTAIRGQGAQNISFAMPVNRIRRLLNEHVYGVEPLLSRLRISVQEPQAADAEKLGVEVGQGVVVTEVDGGLGERIGLQRWDVIASVNDMPTPSEAALSDHLDGLVAGPARLAILREGREETLTLRVPEVDGQELPAEADWFGFTVEGLTNETASRLGVSLDGGVLITEVAERSPAGRAALEPGDLVSGIYYPYPRLYRIRTLGDFRDVVEALEQTEEKVVIEVTRPGVGTQPLELRRQGA